MKIIECLLCLLRLHHFNIKLVVPLRYTNLPKNALAVVVQCFGTAYAPIYGTQNCQKLIISVINYILLQPLPIIITYMYIYTTFMKSRFYYYSISSLYFMCLQLYFNIQFIDFHMTTPALLIFKSCTEHLNRYL